MKTKTLLLAIVLLFTDISADLLHLVSFNPGIKIGYEFGNRPGFIMGIESSLTYASPYYYFISPWGGMVGGLQWNLNSKRLLKYWELEGGWFLAGAAFGGEWDERYYSRYRIFGGFMGYLSYKKRINDNNCEFSFVGKYPCYIYEERDYGKYLFGRKMGG